ncbi:YciI family protein [Pseudoalteromonas sp. '520P1 No. 423']|uniref:YciI family protein n=1 Tax=Pseudoalteromonas sp. '520P1 No. 423' TaxID=1690037 RepID=UPI00352725EF
MLGETYYTTNKFIASGRKEPRTGGVILINAQDKAEVDATIKEDPFYIADVANYDVTEFIPTMAAKIIHTKITYKINRSK